MTLGIAEWQKLATRIQEVNDTNGWDRPTFADLPIKLMLIMTEINEMSQEVTACDNKAAQVELADVAIRTLHTLESLWPGKWVLRRGFRIPHAHKRIEELLWCMITPLCQATEAWRDNNEIDAMIALEYVLSNCRRLSEVLGFDLYATAERKVELNATRGYLHGRKNSGG